MRRLSRSRIDRLEAEVEALERQFRVEDPAIAIAQFWAICAGIPGHPIPDDVSRWPSLEDHYQFGGAFS
jgi:hypothetical protein